MHSLMTYRPIPEPMIRLGALGFTLGRNPADKPHNIQPSASLWNAPDGREMTYTAAQDESRWTQSFVVYYLVSGRYCLSQIYEGQSCRPAVFNSKQAAILFVQELILNKQSIHRQFCIDGPGVDYHVPNTEQGLKDLQFNLPPALRAL